ncbi:polysaccharide deacetylase [Desulforhopalus sp. 52FAK]
MYHRVFNEEYLNSFYVQPGMYVFQETFRRHIEYLKKHYDIITFTDLIERYQNKKDINNTCVITFDDGWHDNYTHAYPILCEYKVPATIFLATNLIGSNRLFWPEEFTLYLNQTDIVTAQERVPLLDRLLKSLLPNNPCGSDYNDAVIAELKNWPQIDRMELLSHLRTHCNEIVIERQLMNWQEVKEMQESGLITFGAHTANHVMLDQVSLSEAEREIVQSFQSLKANLGFTPDVFAYPNGNYNLEIKSLVRKHGFKVATTTKRGRLCAYNDLFEIPRIGMHQDVSSTISLLQARILLRWF